MHQFKDYPRIARIEKLGKRAHDIWGIDASLIKTAEECAELAVVCCKRVGNSPVEPSAIIDEIADVLIMTHRLRNYFDAEKVDARVDFKLDRLEKILTTLENEDKGLENGCVDCRKTPVFGLIRCQRCHEIFKKGAAND